MRTWEIAVKRILLTAAAVTSLLAFAAPGFDSGSGPASAPAGERVTTATATATEGEHPPVLTLPTTQRCSSSRCGGPTDTSWGGGSPARPAL
ncbi:hypothetical protein GO001_02665 [Streptomyces sp. NRRL B-1677]|uniref:hypothetical protein n=1 Tax=Streptomyces sp. NRRL B-1677 TaxID=2682966 RepID=UPI0018928C67|nr:hypothetical protein [Streptomyces sp. NRRL B-1677]MBF6044126.1 hypothetical protein [Streptomyces sp. NRRL B-1677]